MKKRFVLLGMAITGIAWACEVSRAKTLSPSPDADSVQAGSLVQYHSEASSDGKAVFSVAVHGSLSGVGRVIETTTARVTEYGFMDLDQCTKPDSAWDPTIHLRAGPYHATATSTTGSWTTVTDQSQIQIAFAR